MTTVACSLCTTTADNPLVNGAQPDLPVHWSTVTIAELGQRIRNFVLCTRCTTAVRAEMGRLGAAYRDGLASVNP